MNELAEHELDREVRRHRRQRGQVLLLFLIFLLPMTMALFSVYNVGTVVANKMELQNAADNAAYSAAIWDARYMNQMAYINRAMVANYDTIATLVGLWSMIDSLDGLLGFAELIGKIIFDRVDDIVKIIHTPIGRANQIIGTQIVGGSTASATRVARAIELYTQLLSHVQQALYIMYQTSRQQVIERVAWGTHAGAQYWMPAEAYNIYSLNSRREWAGTDKDTGLRLTVSRSLNDFSNGGSIRDGLFAAMPQFIRDIKNLINSIPCPIPGGSFDLSIGIDGFNGYPFNRVQGTVAGVFGTEILVEAGALAGHEIVQDTMISQVDFTGIKISLCVASIGIGHHSHDAWNLGGGKGGVQIGIFPPHVFDANDDAVQHHYDNFSKNGFNCMAMGGFVGELTEGFEALDSGISQCTERSTQNATNKQKKPEYAAVSGSSVKMCHSMDSYGRCFDSSGRPIAGDVRSCKQLQDIFDDVGQDEMNKNLRPCQTAYEFGTPLRKMKVTTFKSDDSLPRTGIAQGPNKLVYMRMKRDRMGLIDSFGIDPLESDYNLQVYSYAKTYFTTRVPPNWVSMKFWQHKSSMNFTMRENKYYKNQTTETLFNPYWSGKLELPNLFSFQAGPKQHSQAITIDPLLH